MVQNQRDEVIAHLQRITSSKTFSSSPRLIEFLRYCVETSVHGEAEQLKESTIGVSVFGRPPDYDPKLDPIVRVHARRLREKLDSFYKTEGKAEEIVVEIRKGGYVPSFASRAHGTTDIKLEALHAGGITSGLDGDVSGELDHSAKQVGIGYTRLPKPVIWSLGTAALLLVGVLVMRWNYLTSWSLPATAHPLWGEMFRPDQSTLLVPGDSGLVIFQGLSMRKTNLDDYLRGEYRTTPHKDASVAESTQNDLGSRRYTSIVDLQIASSLTQKALAQRSQLQVRYARDLRPNDLKLGDVILVGAAEANPWVELYERNMNFVLSNNLDKGIFSVVNRSPKPNELSHWDSARADPQHRVYGVVAFLPNLAGNGNTLILEGTSMAGTEAAWDFVSDDAQLAPFVSSIRRSNGSVPHFEVVLGTNSIGTSAVRTNVLAWRIVG